MTEFDAMSDLVDAQAASITTQDIVFGVLTILVLGMLFAAFYILRSKLFGDRKD